MEKSYRDAPPPPPEGAKKFDPYREWLGITVEEGTEPEKYGLLGVSKFADEKAIAEAVQERIARLEPHLRGPHAKTAAALIKVIRATGNFLLTYEKRARYDNELLRAASITKLLGESDQEAARAAAKAAPSATKPTPDEEAPSRQVSRRVTGTKAATHEDVAGVAPSTISPKDKKVRPEAERQTSGGPLQSINKFLRENPVIAGISAAVVIGITYLGVSSLIRPRGEPQETQASLDTGAPVKTDTPAGGGEKVVVYPPPPVVAPLPKPPPSRVPEKVESNQIDLMQQLTKLTDQEWEKRFPGSGVTREWVNVDGTQRCVLHFKAGSDLRFPEFKNVKSITVVFVQPTGAKREAITVNHPLDGKRSVSLVVDGWKGKTVGYSYVNGGLSDNYEKNPTIRPSPIKQGTPYTLTMGREVQGAFGGEPTVKLSSSLATHNGQPVPLTSYSGPLTSVWSDRTVKEAKDFLVLHTQTDYHVLDIRIIPAEEKK